MRHSWRAFWRVLPALPVLILQRVARGQRETFSNWNAWFILSGDVALDERWSILFDVSARRAGPIDEWQAAFILNKQRPPKKPPGVNDIVRLVAMLGGFLGRKGDGEPGVKTIWIGLQRVMDFAAGLRYARSEHDDE